MVKFGTERDDGKKIGGAILEVMWVIGNMKLPKSQTIFSWMSHSHDS